MSAPTPVEWAKPDGMEGRELDSPRERPFGEEIAARDAAIRATCGPREMPWSGDHGTRVGCRGTVLGAAKRGSEACQRAGGVPGA